MPEQNCNTTLGRNILNDCNEAYGKGVEKYYYVISRDAIDWSASTRTGHIISAITAVSGKRGYKIKNPSNEVPAITVTGTNPAIGTAFDKVLPIVLLANSPENAEAIMGLQQDKYVVIYENTVKGTARPSTPSSWVSSSTCSRSRCPTSSSSPWSFWAT